jgi:hypothetical protein
MSEQQTRDDPVGRSKHLGELALIFKHRHATWHHFAMFLRDIFEDISVGGPNMESTRSGLAEIECRHNSGGTHHTELSSARTGPYRSAFNHVRYSRPCVTLGTYDDKKNPGLVVFDLCVRAKAFLRRIGVGDESEPSGRDFEYDPNVNPHPRLSEESMPDVTPEDLVEINRSNILSSSRRSKGKQEDDSDYGEDFFQAEDVRDLVFQLGNDGPRFSAEQSVSASGMRSSLDSVGQANEQRKTTKMRVATLAYLWGFVNDLPALRTEFRKLRTQPNLNVLHLCGCGLCYTLNGQKVMGCCEASHLMLGSQSLNNMHRMHHQLLALTPRQYYLERVALGRHVLDGSGRDVF